MQTSGLRKCAQPGDNKWYINRWRKCAQPDDNSRAESGLRKCAQPGDNKWGGRECNATRGKQPTQAVPSHGTPGYITNNSILVRVNGEQNVTSQTL